MNLLSHLFRVALPLVLLSASPLLQAQDLRAQTDEIQQRVQMKAGAGKTTEADLAQELNDLSDLMRQHRSNRAACAEILLLRARIYEQVIQDREMTMILHEQVATEYPGTAAGYIAATWVEAARVVEQADRETGGPRPQASGSRATSGGSGSGAPSARAGNSRSSSARNGTESNRSAGSLKEGSVFPDFSVQDIDNTPLSLSQFAGKIVLIDFWAAYNEESVSNIDAKMSVYRRYHGKGFEIIGINRDRSRAPMINFLNERGITWPQYYDEGGQLSRRFNVSDVPASFLLDREGKVLAMNVDLATLVRLLDRQINYGY